MRQILNPFTKIQDYQCFGCAPDNHYGLQMNFVEEEEEIVSYWNPRTCFQGYNNILHGGIQATLMDEIAGWLVFVKLQSSGVTIKMDVRLNKPVSTNAGIITIRARLNEFSKKLAKIDVKIFNHENVESADALITYFVFTKEEADKKLFPLDYSEFLK